jgi:hypothetical protein
MIDQLEIKPNFYADLVTEQFSLPIPILKRDKNGEMAYAPCIVLSESLKRDCRKKAYAETLKAFDGKAPKVDEAGYDVWRQTYDNAHGCWCIFYAVRVPGDLNTRLFLSKEQIENDYTAEEIGILHSHYLTVMINQVNMMHFDENDPNSLSKVMDEIIHQNTVEDTSFLLDSYTTRAWAMCFRSFMDKIQDQEKTIEQLTTLLQQNGLSGLLLKDSNQNQKTQSEEPSV